MSQGMFFDTESVRAFHESESQQQEALAILRRRPLTKISFEQDWTKNGSRLAPAIDALRNGWGFEIEGYGTTKKPYQLSNPNQSPTKVMATKRIQELYYESPHWSHIRESRWQKDNYRCVLCVGSCRDSIRCHHVKYNLFGESLDEVMTVCERHHDMIHENCFLAFPKGVELWIAERLLGVVAYPFEEWLLP
jgi:hypothetical protein